ncbi:MAG: hypothetical protein WB014_10520 [Methanosarcina sp.]
MSAVIYCGWDELIQEPIEKGPDDFENTAGAEGNLTEIKYLMPEGKTPGDRWYEEGNIEFIKASTTSELIIAYYGTVYEIERGI